MAEESPADRPVAREIERVRDFVFWVKRTPHDSLADNSRIAFDAQVRVLDQLLCYLEGNDDYLNACVAARKREATPAAGGATHEEGETHGASVDSDRADLRLHSGEVGEVARDRTIPASPEMYYSERKQQYVRCPPEDALAAVIRQVEALIAQWREVGLHKETLLLYSDKGAGLAFQMCADDLTRLLAGIRSRERTTE